MYCSCHGFTSQRYSRGHVTPDGVVYHQQLDPEHDDLRRMDDDIHDSTYATEHEFGTDDDTPHHTQPRAYFNLLIHIYVNIEVTLLSGESVNSGGLQQHAVIHTDQKPFGCDICGKAFRFKSNLFEHRSVHSGFTPHACPYCGKTCRLKGNLKKHLKTHVSTKEELEEAWKPFASNRRPPADIPDDAIIVRSAGEPFFTPPSRPRKRNLMRRLSELLKSAEENSFNLDEIFEQARALSFERFDCPICKVVFMSRLECVEHIDIEHPMARTERPLFCEVCLRTFADRKAMEQHESYHKRVHLLIEHGDLEIVDPEILLPETCDVMDEEVEAV
ncbi:putative zinc finger protein [Dirofilaria immitis]|nr:putative zinc finger protein [Dirofilaria immitis]